MTIVIKGLPKHSLNKVYSGIHWTKRKKGKEDSVKIKITEI